MIDRIKAQMSDVKLMILNIVIIVLVFLMVILLKLTAEELYYVFSDYKYVEDSFVYAMEEENYGRMIEYSDENLGSLGKEDRKLREYYGVAKYYEAAFYYKMYTEAGDTIRAGEQRILMEAAMEQMGDFAFKAGEIDEILKPAGN